MGPRAVLVCNMKLSLYEFHTELIVYMFQIEVFWVVTSCSVV